MPVQHQPHQLVLRNAPQQCVRLDNSQQLKALPSLLAHLEDVQRNDVLRLVGAYPCLFSDVPTRTSVLTHDINVQGKTPIKQHAYRVNMFKRSVMRTEVDYT